MSLNFRPNHNATSLLAQFRFHSSRFGVLLGCRPSISSVLRKSLLASTLPTLETITSEIPSAPSTAAYLIFSDGNKTIVFEKDHRTALHRIREDFIVVTNHDRASENRGTADENHNAPNFLASGVGEIVAESISRERCIRAEWREAVIHATGADPREDSAVGGEGADLGVSVKRANVVEWLDKWPITNDCTHFTTIMDPKKGDIVWLRRFLEPVDTDSDDSSELSASI